MIIAIVLVGAGIIVGHVAAHMRLMTEIRIISETLRVLTRMISKELVETQTKEMTPEELELVRRQGRER